MKYSSEEPTMVHKKYNGWKENGLMIDQVPLTELVVGEEYVDRTSHNRILILGYDPVSAKAWCRIAGRGPDPYTFDKYRWQHWIPAVLLEPEPEPEPKPNKTEGITHQYVFHPTKNKVPSSIQSVQDAARWIWMLDEWLHQADNRITEIDKKLTMDERLRDLVSNPPARQ